MLLLNYDLYVSRTSQICCVGFAIRSLLSSEIMESMMEITLNFDSVTEELYKQIDITPTQYELAKTHYEAVAKCLTDGGVATDTPSRIICFRHGYSPI